LNELKDDHVKTRTVHTSNKFLKECCMGNENNVQEEEQLLLLID
jgi:hypothetical protein